MKYNPAVWKFHLIKITIIIIFRTQNVTKYSELDDYPGKVKGKKTTCVWIDLIKRYKIK